MWNGPEVAARRAGDRAEERVASADHRRGDIRACRRFKNFALRMPIRTHAPRPAPPRDRRGGGAACWPRASRRPDRRADRRRDHDQAGRRPRRPSRRPPRPSRRSRPRRPPPRRPGPPTGGVVGAERVARQLHGVPRRQRRGTATCRRCPSTPTPATTSPPSPRSAATRSCTPTSAAPASTASRTSPCPGTQALGAASTSPTTATRATPVRTRSRSHAPVEGGSDAHVLAVDRDHCKLYELFAASPGTQPVVGGVGRGVRPHVERAASRGVDVGRRRRPADLRRARALRRGRERPHRPRAPLHRVALAAGVPAPGDALGVVEHRRQPAADGAAPAAEGELRRRRRTPARRASCSTR